MEVHLKKRVKVLSFLCYKDTLLFNEPDLENNTYLLYVSKE